MRARTLLIAIAAASAGVFCGCRNPFNPSSEVELVAIAPPEIVVYYADVGASTINFAQWRVTCQLVVRNKVGITLTSANIVYTDTEGTEVTAYKTSGGRNFKMLARLEGVNQNQFNSGGYGVGNVTPVELYLIDMPVLDELRAGNVKTMYATISLRGQDDNGYDVMVSGRTTIRTFQFP